MCISDSWSCVSISINKLSFVFAEVTMGGGKKNAFWVGGSDIYLGELPPPPLDTLKTNRNAIFFSLIVTPINEEKDLGDLNI